MLIETRNEQQRAFARMEAVFDPGSMTLFGRAAMATDPQASTVTASGMIGGRRAFAFADDAEAIGEEDATEICRVLEDAERTGAPLVGFRGSSDLAPRRPSLENLGAHARVLDRYIRASGVVPHVTVVDGRLTGVASFSAGLSDIVIATDVACESYVNNPDAVYDLTSHEVTPSELGGAVSLATKSGVADLVTSSETAADHVRYVLSFLGDNNLQSPPYFPPTDSPARRCNEIERLLPVSPTVPYDVVDVIKDIVDDGEVLQLKETWARNIVTAFARLDGYAIGIVGSQPGVLAGTLDIDSSIKGAAFVRLCDSFNVPLLAILDVPGFRPGIDEEYRGIIRHGAKLVYAFAQATVPRVTLIARKAYGGAYLVMNSRHIRADLSYAWPTAEIAVMGAEGAARIIHRKKLAAADDPTAEEARLVAEYRDAFANPYRAAERGYIDAVVRPIETRRRLIESFAMLRHKRESLPGKKHGNIPL